MADEDVVSDEDDDEFEFATIRRRKGFKRPAGVKTGDVAVSNTAMKRVYSAMIKKATDGDTAAAKLVREWWKDQKVQQIMDKQAARGGKIDMSFAKEE